MKKQILMRIAVAVITASVLITTVPAIAVNAADIEAETVVTSEEMQDSTQNANDDVEEGSATDEIAEDEQIVVTFDEEDSDDVISEDGENYKDESYEYSLNSGVVTIDKYIGTEEDVEVPDKVTIDGSEYTINTIGSKAFADNVAIKTVVIPERIKYLGALAFSNCTSLSKVTIKGDIADCDGRVITVQDSWYSVFYNAGKNASSFEVVFAEGVTRIPALIFATNSPKQNDVYAHVTKVTIPNSVTEIGANAFYCCYGLKDIVWGTGVKNIYGDAFAGCQGITELVLPASVELIDFRAFKECTSLAKLVVNSKCTFGKSAFGNCVALTDVTLDKGGSLGACTFENDTMLSKLTINGDITDCDGRIITVQDSWYSEFYNAGKNASSFEVVFGSGVTRIPALIFATNSPKQNDTHAHITKVSIPVTTESIGEKCLWCCYDLKEIEFEGTEARWNKLISEGDNPLSYLSDNNIKMTFGNKPYGKEAELICVKGQKGIKLEEAKKVKADGKEYRITTSDKKVAKLSKNGVLTCVGEGSAVITVIKQGGVTLTYNVKVVAPSSYTKSYKMEVGRTQTPDFKIDKKFVKVTYTSSKPEVVTVDAETGKMTAVAKGSAKVYIDVHTLNPAGEEIVAKTYKIKVKVKG